MSLTPLELGLFRHVREREGRIVTRSELLREVWGTEFTGGSNVVDAVVRTLRHKLGTAGLLRASRPSRRGAGYNGAGVYPLDDWRYSRAWRSSDTGASAWGGSGVASPRRPGQRRAAGGRLARVEQEQEE